MKLPWVWVAVIDIMGTGGSIKAVFAETSKAVSAVYTRGTIRAG